MKWYVYNKRMHKVEFNGTLEGDSITDILDFLESYYAYGDIELKVSTIVWEDDEDYSNWRMLEYSCYRISKEVWSVYDYQAKRVYTVTL